MSVEYDAAVEIREAINELTLAVRELTKFLGEHSEATVTTTYGDTVTHQRAFRTRSK
jgi:hypothetical protein